MFLTRLNWQRAAFCLAIVGGISLATATFAAPDPGADRKPTLEHEVRAQFDLAYRLHPAEAQARLEQLKVIMAAWRAAPATDANKEKLEAWLRAAIRSSMPGSHEPLPAAPNFAVVTEREPLSMNHAPVATPAPAQSSMPKSASTVAVAKPAVATPALPQRTDQQPTAERSLIAKPQPIAEPVPAAKQPLLNIQESDFDPFLDDPADQQMQSSK